jgi:hypothetical protein
MRQRENVCRCRQVPYLSRRSSTSGQAAGADAEVLGTGSRRRGTTAVGAYSPRRTGGLSDRTPGRSYDGAAFQARVTPARPWRYRAIIARMTAALRTNPVSATIWEMSGPSNRMHHLSARWSRRMLSSTSQFSACPCPWFPSRGSDGLLARPFRTMRRYRGLSSRCCRASLSSARSASITSSN